MIAELKYNTILKHQRVDVDKNRKLIYFFPASHVFHLIRSWIINRLNSTLSNQLIFAKGLVSDLKDRVNELGGKDLNIGIDHLNDLIKVNILLKDSIEKSNNQALQNADILLSDTIENYYTALRILKRKNNRSSIETSQLAKESCRHSLNSLQTVINGRRTT